MSSTETPQQLHIFFLPLLTAQGHIIPMVEMAKLFAAKGTKTTIITAPQNQTTVSTAIHGARSRSHNKININILTIAIPPSSSAPPTDMLRSILHLTTSLRRPIHELIQEHRPDCLVADMFFPWATDLAAEFGIPRIVFHGVGFFALSAAECVRLYEPHKKVESESEPFVIPNFPGEEIKLTRSQMHPYFTMESETSRFFGEVKESEVKSYGVLVNSFYELETAYADHFRDVLGRRAWHIGPLSLWDSDNDGEENKQANGEECFEWLRTKQPKSVVYMCFGSIADFDSSQLFEIAMGLEASDLPFIWVVKKAKKDEEKGKEEWLPEGFEERVSGKGLIIRGWAPQSLILAHQAIGGFVTHCGWNSVLEAVCGGVPMVTWPVGAEQFYNEKLVTEILRIGIGVGAKKWAVPTGDFVKRDAVERAVTELMRVDEMRSRAKSYAEMARKAIQEGGSSHSHVNAFIQELSANKIKAPPTSN